MSKPKYSDDFVKLNADVLSTLDMETIHGEQSKYEAEFARQLAFYQLEQFFEAELQFDPTRKYRFDWGNRDRKIGIEIDGGNNMVRVSRRTGKPVAVGRHAGSDDYRKLNLATSQGWHVYRFTGEMVTSGEAINFISGILLPF